MRDQIRLPLWALMQARFDDLGRRVAAFERHHGHPPGDDSTLVAWWEVTPDLSERLGDVTCALPLVYPDRRRGLLLAVVEVAYLAACRAQPSNNPDPRSAAALALVKRWLAGEDMPAAWLCAAAQEASAAARDADHGRHANAERAANAARAAAYAARAAAERASYAYDPSAKGVATYAADAAAAAFVAADETERCMQVEDLDALLLGLAL